MKTTSEDVLPLRKLFAPHYQLNFFLMTSHLNSHGTTDIKPEMLSGVQTGNGIQHVEYDICGIAHMHA